MNNNNENIHVLSVDDLCLFSRLIDVYAEKIEIMAEEFTRVEQYHLIVKDYKKEINTCVSTFIECGVPISEIMYEFYENYQALLELKDETFRREFLKSLINHGADLDHKYDNGETLLYWAVLYDEVELTKDLLSYGASPELFLDIEGKLEHISSVFKNESAALVEKSLKIKNNSKELDEKKTLTKLRAA